MAYMKMRAPGQSVWQETGGEPDASHPLQELKHCAAVQGALAEAVSGVYSGWASIGSSPQAYMTAMSIGGCPCALKTQAAILFSLVCISWLHHYTCQQTQYALSMVIHLRWRW